MTAENKQGQKQGQQQLPMRGSFAALRMTAKNKQGQEQREQQIPRGMTSREATERVKAETQFLFPNLIPNPKSLIAEP
jgi:hypothetical protein